MRLINSTLVRLISKVIGEISCELNFTINLSTKMVVFVNWMAIQKSIKPLKCLQIRNVLLNVTNIKTVSNNTQTLKTNEFGDTFILNELFWLYQNELIHQNSLKI